MSHTFSQPPSPTMTSILLSTAAIILVALPSAFSQTTCEPGFFLTSKSTCLKCPAGTAQPQSGQIGCIPCHAEDVAPQPGAVECASCGENELANDIHTQCICKPGTGRDFSGQDCSTCPPGTFNSRFGNGTESVCSPCQQGFFQPLSGQQECTSCPSGTFSLPGATSCSTPCPPGEVFIAGRCGVCPPGQSYLFFGLRCASCPMDTFKPTAGQGPCLPCPSGSFSGRRARECVACPPGQALIGRGMNATCGSCPAGSFYDSFRRRCRTCDTDTFQPEESIRTRCFQCAGNEFSRRGASECIQCGFDETLLRDGSCGSCRRNFFINMFTRRCTRCPFNSFSAGGIVRSCTHCPAGSVAQLDAGSCEECPDGGALIARTGRCGKCSRGRYYNQFDGRCRLCENGSIRPIASVLMFCDPCPNGTTSNVQRTECIAE